MEYVYNPLANWPQKKITILILKNALEMKKNSIQTAKEFKKIFICTPNKPKAALSERSLRTSAKKCIILCILQNA